MTSAVVVADRVAQVRGRVAAACADAGREPSAVRIVAVTKTHPPAVAQEAVDAGLTDLGENRVEELLAKVPLVEGSHWHLVGQLQRRKARDLVGRHVLVHSVDRRSLAETLARRAADVRAVQRVLVQVNVGDDPRKGGCPVDQTMDLVAYARDLPYLTVEGLMTIPPLPPEGSDAGVAAAPHFATLRQLRDEARASYPEVVHLSMGMTADLEAAIAQGATMIRVGTALFGPRGRGPWTPEDSR